MDVDVQEHDPGISGASRQAETDPFNRQPINLSDKEHLKPKFQPGLSATEKKELLSARERRWLTVDPACTRTFTIGGPAGVYELQEGIFLLCPDIPFTEQRVSLISTA